MRAIWITKAGGPGALELRETADPEPGPGQVRVRVRAAGLCFADVMAAQGLYPDAPKPPCVVGYEAAGAVDELVTFGTASAAKHEVLRAEGCRYPIDYRTVDYAAEIRRLTGGEGVDVVLDALGGKDWRKGLKLLRPGGRLVAFGFANFAR